MTVYQEESITRAAEKLHMTQPATSLAIREMEEYYHTKLFERSGRGIRVTSAGTRLYPSAARLLSLYDEMDAEMKTGTPQENFGSVPVSVSVPAFCRS